MPPEDTALENAKTTEVESSTTDTKDDKAESSTAKTEPQEKSFADVAKEAYDAVMESEDGPEKEEESPVPKKDTTEEEEAPEKSEEEEEPSEDDTEQQEEGEDEAEEESEDKSKEPDPNSKLAFHKHPRFQELKQERDELKTRAETAEKSVATFKEKSEAYDYHVSYLRQYNITDQDMAAVMSALAARQSDPMRAKQLLKPLWDSLTEVDPSVLPKDLQQQVNDGDITEELAQRLWAAECQGKVTKVNTQQLQQQQTAALMQSVESAVDAWDNARRKSDPAFKPKAKPDAPDGLWEFVGKEYEHLVGQHLREGKAYTPQANVALIEAAYKKMKAFFNSRQPQSQVRKVPKSFSSSKSVKPKGDPATLDGELDQIAKKYGLTFRRPKAE